MTDTLGTPLMVSPMQLGARRSHDIVFAFVYVALFVASIAIAVRSAASARNNLADITKECTNITSSSRANQFGAALRGDDDSLIPDVYDASWSLGLALILSIVLGCAWMAILKRAAKAMIYTTLILGGLMQICLGIYLADVYGSSVCYSLSVLGVLFLVLLCCRRSRIELTAKLLEQAVQVVADNPGLVGASAGLLLIKIFVLACGVAAVALLFASQLVITKTGYGNCEFDWVAHRADELMYAALLLFLVWSVTLWLWLRFYVVAFTTGVWYYERVSLAAQDGIINDKAITRAPVSTGMRLALSKGFGTIAFASLVVTVCEWLKALARREARDGGIVSCLVACCITCITNCLEYLTRFALVFSALTGDGLCTAGKGFLSTCKRHGFFTVAFVDYLANITLNVGAFVFGLLVSAITVTIVRYSRTSYTNDRDLLLAVGPASWVLAMLVLCFLSSLLLNIVDASYSCIVLDVDSHERTGSFRRPAIAHAVLAKVKPEYVVVEQPAGGSAVGHSHVAVPIATAVPVGQPRYAARP